MIEEETLLRSLQLIKIPRSSPLRPAEGEHSTQGSAALRYLINSHQSLYSPPETSPPNSVVLYIERRVDADRCAVAVCAMSHSGAVMHDCLTMSRPLVMMELFKNSTETRESFCTISQCKDLLRLDVY